MQRQDPPRNINPPELARPRGFSHATVAGDTIWIGGQTGDDATGGVIAKGDIVAQFTRAVANLATALRAAGSGPENTVKLTYYVTDVAAYKQNLGAIGSAYREVFGRHYPATTLVEVRSLFDPDALVEIDAVAVRST